MTTNSLVRILWNGKESVDEAIQFIGEHHNLEFDLPASFHHAFFCHIYPDADPGASEFVDIEDGVDLLRKIATIKGLELFSDMIEPVKAAGAKVIIVSPTPRIFIGH